MATLYRPETRCLRNTPPFLASLSPTQPSVFPEPRHASNATCCDLPPPPRVVCEPTRPLHQVYTVVITRALGGETTLASLTVFGQQAAASASGWTYDVPLPLNQTFYSSATALQVRHDPPSTCGRAGLGSYTGVRCMRHRSCASHRYRPRAGGGCGGVGNLGLWKPPTRKQASARLVLVVSAGWASPSSRHLWVGYALLPSTGDALLGAAPSLN